MEGGTRHDLRTGRRLLAQPPWRGTGLITRLFSDEGFLYLAFILDVYSRKVIGWSMASHLRSELPYPPGSQDFGV